MGGGGATLPEEERRGFSRAASGLGGGGEEEGEAEGPYLGRPAAPYTPPGGDGSGPLERGGSSGGRCDLYAEIEHCTWLASKGGHSPHHPCGHKLACRPAPPMTGAHCKAHRQLNDTVDSRTSPRTPPVHTHAPIHVHQPRAYHKRTLPVLCDAFQIRTRRHETGGVQ